MNLELLQAVGLTPEELQQRVVVHVSEMLLKQYEYDPEDNSSYSVASRFAKQAQENIKAAIDLKFEQVAREIIVPMISEQVDNLIIQRTSQYGEKKGAAVTFLEYLTERVDQILTEPVDAQGRTKAECERARDSWYAGKTNMVTNLIGAEVDKQISRFAQDMARTALDQVKEALVTGLAATFDEAKAKTKISIVRS